MIFVLHCSTEIASEDVEKLGVRWNWKIEKSQLRQMDSANSSSNSTERMAKTWGFTQNLGWQGSRLIWLKSDWCRRRRRCRRCVLFHDGITWERFELSSWFLSATEYIPSRTIIQPGWLSLSSSSSSSLSSLCTFSRWDNSRTLWAIKLIFCMVICHD